jgi:hypothetical protein
MTQRGALHQRVLQLAVLQPAVLQLAVLLWPGRLASPDKAVPGPVATAS